MNSKRSGFVRKTLIATLIITTTMAMTMPPRGWAMLAPAQAEEGVDTNNAARMADLKVIQAALESKIVRQRLADYKFTPDQIDSKLKHLSDAQLHQTATQIKSISPGGDGGGLVVTVLLVAILVALFMYVFRRI